MYTIMHHTICIDKVFLVAIEHDLITEIQWASRRKRSLAQPNMSCPPELFDLHVLNRFTICLTISELRRLIVYRQLLRKRQHADSSMLCCYLNQDPSKGFGIMTSANTMSTIIAHSGIIWCEHVARWFTVRELALMQGFIAFTDLASFGDSSCFSIVPTVVGRTAAAEQIGNSMNTHAIALPLIYSMFCVSWRPTVQLTPLMRRWLALTTS